MLLTKVLESTGLELSRQALDRVNSVDKMMISLIRTDDKP